MSRVDHMDLHRCRAKAKGTGVQCGNRPAVGQRVCWTHGAKSPQALAKAEERLRDLEHPAITALGVLIASGDFQAVRWLLEVLGHKATEKIQQDGRVVIEVELVERASLSPPKALSNGHAQDSAT